MLRKNEAFFLHVGFADPHHPHALPGDWLDRPAPGDIPPPVGRAGELEDLPPHFEPLIRVPLILRWPGELPEGESSAGITSLADIAPTVLSAAGLAAPDAADGHDLRPALNGEASWPREYAMVEHFDDPDHLRPRTIVTQDDKRTVYTDRSFGEYFDLRSDPDELHNRWDDPACAERREELEKRLERHPPAPLSPVPRVALA